MLNDGSYQHGVCNVHCMGLALLALLVQVTLCEPTCCHMDRHTLYHLWLV